jgi:hypothetical protein
MAHLNIVDVYPYVSIVDLPWSLRSIVIFLLARKHESSRATAMEIDNISFELQQFYDRERVH